MINKNCNWNFVSFIYSYCVQECQFNFIKSEQIDWWNPSAKGAKSSFKTIGAYYK